MLFRSDARIVRLAALKRSTPAVSSEQTTINPNTYYVRTDLADIATPTPVKQIVFKDDYASPSSDTDIHPYTIMAFSAESMIPEFHNADSMVAVLALTRHQFMSQTDKQWGATAQQAQVELNKYNDAVSRIRHKVMRGNNHSELSVRTTRKFI